MKTFKSISSVEQLRNHPLHATIKELVTTVITEYTEYRPMDDGYLVLIERNDVDRVLNDLDMPWRLSEIPFEAVTMVDDCYYAVYVPNNQYSLGILIPNEAWLPNELRRQLEMHLNP